jgi:hypothetical protein
MLSLCGHRRSFAIPCLSRTLLRTLHWRRLALPLPLRPLPRSPMLPALTLSVGRPPLPGGLMVARRYLHIKQIIGEPHTWTYSIMSKNRSLSVLGYRFEYSWSVLSGHLSFALLGLSFALHDIVWLRALAAVVRSVYCVGGVIEGMSVHIQCDSAWYVCSHVVCASLAVSQWHLLTFIPTAALCGSRSAGTVCLSSSICCTCCTTCPRRYVRVCCVDGVFEVWGCTSLLERGHTLMLVTVWVFARSQYKASRLREEEVDLFKLVFDCTGISKVDFLKLSRCGYV